MQRYYISYNTLIGCKLNFNFFHKNSKKQNKKLALTLFMILFKKSRNIISNIVYNSVIKGEGKGISILGRLLYRYGTSFHKFMDY